MKAIDDILEDTRAVFFPADDLCGGGAYDVYEYMKELLKIAEARGKFIEPMAVQMLTDDQLDSIREEHIGWTGDFYRCESPELAAFVHDIVHACATAWGVKLEGGAA